MVWQLGAVTQPGATYQRQHKPLVFQYRFLHLWTTLASLPALATIQGCNSGGAPKLSAINIMLSAAIGATLISNSVAPSPMVMYFITIFPYPVFAPVTGACGLIVI
jgi:hypothetical protein